MKMPCYLESKAEVYGCLEELQIDPRDTRACTPGWNITVIASMPQKGITMKINAEVILGQQLAVQADGFLEIIDKSLKPVTGGQMIVREQEAAGVCYLWAKRGHISGNCPGLKLGGPQDKAECVGSWYRSNVNMQNLPKLFKIRKKPILDPGATMHQQAGLASGIATHQSMARSSNTRKSQETSATETGKEAGTMTWRLLTRCSERMRWISSRRLWKLSGFSGRLIMN
jgi:hypothetical protein